MPVASCGGRCVWSWAGQPWLRDMPQSVGRGPGLALEHSGAHPPLKAPAVPQLVKCRSLEPGLGSPGSVEVWQVAEQEHGWSEATLELAVSWRLAVRVAL